MLSMLADGRPIETTPTIGLAMKSFSYGGSTIKVSPAKKWKAEKSPEYVSSTGL
jgi:hypothetical protein